MIIKIKWGFNFVDQYLNSRNNTLLFVTNKYILRRRCLGWSKSTLYINIVKIFKY